MKKIITFFALLFTLAVSAQQMKSIMEYGVSPSNTPEQNRANLQRAYLHRSVRAVCGLAEHVKGFVGVGFPRFSVSSAADGIGDL